MYVQYDGVVLLWDEPGETTHASRTSKKEFCENVNKRTRSVASSIVEARNSAPESEMLVVVTGQEANTILTRTVDDSSFDDSHHTVRLQSSHGVQSLHGFY